jgi:endonuclease/exonuclease/phosphatase (EEP) superfamily protein YafD
VVLTRLLAGALVLLVAVRLLGAERGTVLVLLVGALPLTLLWAYPVLLAAAALRQRWLTLVAGGLVAAHLLVIAPALGAAELPAGARDAPRLRVVTANLYVLNHDPAAAGRALRAAAPDVLVVPELDAAGLAGLDAAGLLADLPHVVVDQDGGEESVGLLSRLPLRDVDVRRVAGRRLPRATVGVGGADVRVLAAHPLPPLSVLEDLWRRSLADLAAETRAVELPTVVAGDLNADRHHAAFRDLLTAGLRDAHDERGRGLARTWPAALPLLHLDHVLVRDGEGAELAVLDVRELEVPGSDHLAVIADLAVLRR